MPMKSFDDGIVAHPRPRRRRRGRARPARPGPGQEGRRPQEGRRVAGRAKASGRRDAQAEAAAPDAAGAEPRGAGQRAAEPRGRRPSRRPWSRLRRPAAGSRRARWRARSRRRREVDLGRVQGTGPGGRVIRRDVEAFLATRTRRAAAGRPARPPPPPRPRRTAAADRAHPAHAGCARRSPSGWSRPSRPRPRSTSPSTSGSTSWSPIREELNKQLAAEKIKLSLGDFVTKAVALALRRHPGVNAIFEPDAIVRHGEVNIGIAVALDGGLIVPVLHNADTLGLREIRVQSEALADRRPRRASSRPSR